MLSVKFNHFSKKKRKFSLPFSRGCLERQKEHIYDLIDPSGEFKSLFKKYRLSEIFFAYFIFFSQEFTDGFPAVTFFCVSIIPFSQSANLNTRDFTIDLMNIPLTGFLVSYRREEKITSSVMTCFPKPILPILRAAQKTQFQPYGHSLFLYGDDNAERSGFNNCT